MDTPIRIGHHPIQYKTFSDYRVPTNWKNKSLLEKVKFVAKVAFSILLSLILFWMNPAIFFISFVIGLAFSQTIQKAVDKIKIFITQYKWPALIGGVVAAVVVLPVFFASASAVCGAYMGSYLSQQAQWAYNKKRQEHRIIG